MMSRLIQHTGSHPTVVIHNLQGIDRARIYECPGCGLHSGVGLFQNGPNTMTNILFYEVNAGDLPLLEEVTSFSIFVRLAFSFSKVWTKSDSDRQFEELAALAKALPSELDHWSLPIGGLLLAPYGCSGLRTGVQRSLHARVYHFKWTSAKQ